jgi:hypothetical protein
MSCVLIDEMHLVCIFVNYGHEFMSIKDHLVSFYVCRLVYHGEKGAAHHPNLITCPVYYYYSCLLSFMRRVGFGLNISGRSFIFV